MSIKRNLFASALMLSLFTPVAANFGTSYSSVQASDSTSKVSKGEAIKVTNYLFTHERKGGKGIDLRQYGTSTKKFDKKVNVMDMKEFTRVNVNPLRGYKLILDITKSGKVFHVHFHGKAGLGQYGTDKIAKWISANSKEAKDEFGLKLKEYITINESKIDK
ncbi:hypothetical protein ACYATP_00050 [Lactobacillaceae bacterium Melli_B4]